MFSRPGNRVGTGFSHGPGKAVKINLGKKRTVGESK
jgi:hypothetical protein